MKKTLLILSLLAGAFCFQSCLFEQEDIFEESASARVQARMDECQKALVAQEYGWEMDVYPDEDQTYGGYAFTLKFHGDSVDVQTEIAVDPTKVITSLYKTTTDNGATLSFDTYNTFFHYFATPSSYLYSAYGGEFEFIILDVQKDLIKLKGSKTGNIVYLRALTMPATDYINKAVAMDEYFQSWLPTIGNDDVTIEILTKSREAIVTDKFTGDQTRVALCTTPTGVRFFEPVDYADGQISEIVPYEKEGNFAGATADNGVDVPWVKPDGWEDFDEMDFSGNWLLHCKRANTSNELEDTTIPVTFEKYKLDDGEKGYLMKGVFAGHDIRLNYIQREGKLNFRAYYMQRVAASYPLMYMSPARSQYGTTLIASYYLQAGGYPDRGMMFASDGKGGYDYVNNKVYTDIDYDCIMGKIFSEDLYDYYLLVGDDWLVTGSEPTLDLYYRCICYNISKLERVK